LRRGVQAEAYQVKRPIEILTPAECDALLAHCGRGKTAPRNRAMIALMWRAGLRAGEVVALLPKDVDLSHGTVRVLHGKGDKSRTVGLDATASAMLQLWIAARARLPAVKRSSRLFCSIRGGKPVHPSYLRQLLPRVAKRAGIRKRVHPHGLRHSCMVHLSREGLPLPLIQAALGHANISTTNHYLAHVEPRELIDAMRSRTKP